MLTGLCGPVLQLILFPCLSFPVCPLFPFGPLFFSRGSVCFGAGSGACWHSSAPAFSLGEILTLHPLLRHKMPPGKELAGAHWLFLILKAAPGKERTTTPLPREHVLKRTAAILASPS